MFPLSQLERPADGFASALYLDFVPMATGGLTEIGIGPLNATVKVSLGVLYAPLFLALGRVPLRVLGEIDGCLPAL